jgi:hypothetical protein
MGKLFPAERAGCHTFCFCTCSQDKSVIPLHQDTRICTQLKSCTLTIFCLRDSFVPNDTHFVLTFASFSQHLRFAQGLRRDAAPVPFQGFTYQDYISSIYPTCTPDDASHVRTFGATAPALNKNCTMTAKNTCPTLLAPGLLPAKVPGHCTDASSSNAYKLYRRAVTGKLITMKHLDKLYN